MVKDVKPANTTGTTKVVTLDDLDNQQNMGKMFSYVLTAIILALGGYFGYEYYQNHGGRVDTASAQAFTKTQSQYDSLSRLSQTVSQADSATADQQAQLASGNTALQQNVSEFVKSHPNSVYTWQALMLQAKQQSDAENYKEAVATLQQASQLKLDDAGLMAIATLRYAQALLANGQADEAEKALTATLPPAFDPSKNELLGDIAMAKNNKAKATEFYQKAWAGIETRNKDQASKEDRALLRLKLEGLGISTTAPDLDNVVVKPKTTPTVAPAEPAKAESTTAKTDVKETVKTETKTAEKTAEKSDKSDKKSDVTDEKSADKKVEKTETKVVTKTTTTEKSQ